jgi:hypothetical protein
VSSRVGHVLARHVRSGLVVSRLVGLVSSGPVVSSLVGLVSSGPVVSSLVGPVQSGHVVARRSRSSRVVMAVACHVGHVMPRHVQLVPSRLVGSSPGWSDHVTLVQSRLDLPCRVVARWSCHVGPVVSGQALVESRHVGPVVSCHVRSRLVVARLVGHVRSGLFLPRPGIARPVSSCWSGRVQSCLVASSRVLLA